MAEPSATARRVGDTDSISPRYQFSLGSRPRSAQIDPGKLREALCGRK
jgi:hypothetical protein